MRKILFRGQTRRHGEKVRVGDGKKLPGNWVYGGIFPGTGDFSIIYGGDSEALKVSTLDKHTVYSDTVGQYTGLNDKNGKMIFEGDIIRLEYTGKNRGVEGIAAVIFENGKFGVKWGWHKDFVCLDGFANTTLEVVGTIYDNPEMLGGDKK